MSFQKLFLDPAASFGSRRAFLRRAGNGMGLLALANLFQQEAAATSVDTGLNPMAARPSHFPAKAKNIIWLFMNGGPSHVDTWDYKPELAKRDGQDLKGFDKTTGFFADQVGPVMKSPFRFARHGQSGAWVSEIVSGHGPTRRQDGLHSLLLDRFQQSLAGSVQNQHGHGPHGLSLPGLVGDLWLGERKPKLAGLHRHVRYARPRDSQGPFAELGSRLFTGHFPGNRARAEAAPINDLYRPADRTDRQQRNQLDLMARLNRRHLEHEPDEPELAARIESFELAYRMQMAAPEVLDLNREPASIQRLYGLDNPKCTHFAKQCLIARRLIERGVRCVQIYSGGMDNQLSWDGHMDILGNHGGFAKETDTPVAGLLTDLESRGLLDSTLVIWGGEFGRLPLAQKNAKPGRDHNPNAFTTWLAGAGVKGGVHYGQTDEIGLKSVIDRVSINDLHATILHLLGIDHKRLTYRYNGRDFRLTDVAGQVVKAVLA